MTGYRHDVEVNAEHRVRWQRVTAFISQDTPRDDMKR